MIEPVESNIEERRALLSSAVLPNSKVFLFEVVKS
jgi:hypothetical protein